MHLRIHDHGVGAPKQFQTQWIGRVTELLQLLTWKERKNNPPFNHATLCPHARKVYGTAASAWFQNLQLFTRIMLLEDIYALVTKHHPTYFAQMLNLYKVTTIVVVADSYLSISAIIRSIIILIRSGANPFDKDDLNTKTYDFQQKTLLILKFRFPQNGVKKYILWQDRRGFDGFWKHNRNVSWVPGSRIGISARWPRAMRCPRFTKPQILGYCTPRVCKFPT